VLRARECIRVSESRPSQLSQATSGVQIGSGTEKKRRCEGGRGGCWRKGQWRWCNRLYLVLGWVSMVRWYLHCAKRRRRISTKKATYCIKMEITFFAGDLEWWRSARVEWRDLYRFVFPIWCGCLRGTNLSSPDSDQR
jgi:hypothetical protein